MQFACAPSSGKRLPRPWTGDLRVSLASKVTGWTIGTALGAVAGLRGGKAVHPHGEAYGARLIVSGNAAAPTGAALLSQPGEYDAVVRFSRSLGLPRPAPDLLGLAVRVLNAYGEELHQDFLMVSSVDHPILHYIFLPSSDLQQRPYSSSLPYRAGRELFLIGALPDDRSPRPSGVDEFARFASAVALGDVRFHLAVAPITGRFEPVAELRIRSRLKPEVDALRFNPWNTGGGLEPAGTLNLARDRAYKLSQAAWRRSAKNGAQRQDTAEREFGMPDA